MNKYKAIHFDMDGVIADTEPYHVAAEQQTCRDFDFAIDPDQWGGFKGMTATAIFTYLRENYGTPNTPGVEELIDHKTNLFIDMTWSKLQPIDGALEFVAWARRNAEKVALVTSSNRRVQSHIIGSFGIGKHFDHVITGDDVINGKPHPEPYLLSVAKAGIAAEQSLVIEDSKSGITSARLANCAVMAITTSHPAEELREANPTYIADSYDQATELLMRDKTMLQ